MAADYSNSISLAQELALHWLQRTDTLRRPIYTTITCSSRGGISTWARKASTDKVRLTCACVSIRVDAENIVLNDLDWTREERYVRNRVCLSVYRTGRVCLSTSLEECPVSDLDLYRPAADKQEAGCCITADFSWCLCDLLKSICTGEIILCHMLLYFYISSVCCDGFNYEMRS